MAIHNMVRGAAYRPKQQVSTVSRVPAPQKGIDDRVPFAEGAERVCLYSFNLVPSDGGLGLRKGYSRWQTGLDDGNGLSVNTMMPFDGIAADGSEDRLFAVTNEGIWNVTVRSETPSLEVTFGTQTADAGFGVYTVYITDAGDKLMFYADSLNGLYTYDVSTDSWAQATGFTGPTIANVNFIMVHKARIWLIERNSTQAWYLAPGAVTGAATAFYFGSKFKNGGALRGLFSWSVDGGVGVDDLLVGVSGGGDVIVYKGDDPSSADTWGMRGVYFIGTLPKGVKFGTEQGGELYLLSLYGVVGMTDLLNGVAVASAQQNSVSASIAGELRSRLKADSGLSGWSIRSIPTEGGLLISTPSTVFQRPIQYYYNLTVNGWGFWRDLDVQSFSTWKTSVVFGDGGLRVLIMDQALDDVTVPGDPGTFNGIPIEFSTLTSFLPLGAPAVFKRVKFIRPDTIGTEEPVFAVAARYDYALAEGAVPIAPTPSRSGGLWDSGLWDSAVWGSSLVEGFGSVYGANGIGRSVAVAYRGLAYSPFTLVGWDVIYDVGGPM